MKSNVGCGLEKNVHASDFYAMPEKSVFQYISVFKSFIFIVIEYPIIF